MVNTIVVRKSERTVFQILEISWDKHHELFMYVTWIGVAGGFVYGSNWKGSKKEEKFQTQKGLN